MFVSYLIRWQWWLKPEITARGHWVSEHCCCTGCVCSLVWDAFLPVSPFLLLEHQKEWKCWVRKSNEFSWVQCDAFSLCDWNILLCPFPTRCNQFQQQLAEPVSITYPVRKELLTEAMAAWASYCNPPSQWLSVCVHTLCPWHVRGS